MSGREYSYCLLLRLVARFAFRSVARTVLPCGNERKSDQDRLEDRSIVRSFLRLFLGC